MFLTAILFFVGFYILVKGAGVFVDGVSSIAYKFGISTFLVGILIVGVGTSLPELGVTFIANLSGDAELAVSTVVGSNIFNLLFALGVAALFSPIIMRKEWTRRDLLWNLIAASLAGVFVYLGELPRWAGIAMIFLFLLWIYQVFSRERISNHYKVPEATSINRLSLAVGMSAAGIAGIILGGKWVVDGAVVFAEALGASQALIGLTILSIGTSINEFVISVISAFKKKMGLAVGNIIGSTIFNFLVVLGASSIAVPIVFPPWLLFDFAFFAVVAFLLYVLMRRGEEEERTLSRLEGLGLVGLYIFYFIFVIVRG